jgi:hypothetical protein
MTSSCKKEEEQSKIIDKLVNLVHQYLKCLVILGCIFALICIRKSMSQNLTVGRVFAYILLACLAMVIIYMADPFAYNNLLVGLGAYFGFELVKFV